MILNAKELIELANDMDENCIDFAIWFFETVAYFDEKKDKYYFNDFEFYNKVELLDIYKKEKYANQIKK